MREILIESANMSIQVPISEIPIYFHKQREEIQQLHKKKKELEEEIQSLNKQKLRDGRKVKQFLQNFKRDGREPSRFYTCEKRAGISWYIYARPSKIC